VTVMLRFGDGQTITVAFLMRTGSETGAPPATLSR